MVNGDWDVSTSQSPPLPSVKTMDITTGISVLALVMSLVSLVISLRQQKIMERELKEETFSGIEMHILSSRFATGQHEFLVSILKNGKGSMTEFQMFVSSQKAEKRLQIKPNIPIQLTNSSPFILDIFPELDALLLSIGIYDFAHKKISNDNVIAIDIISEWKNSNSDTANHIFSFRLIRDISSLNKAEWTVA